MIHDKREVYSQILRNTKENEPEHDSQEMNWNRQKMDVDMEKR